jgi:hypothetical protein
MLKVVRLDHDAIIHDPLPMHDDIRGLDDVIACHDAYDVILTLLSHFPLFGTVCSDTLIIFLHVHYFITLT